METWDEAVSESGYHFTVYQELACKTCGGRKFTVAAKDNAPVICDGCRKTVGTFNVEWRDV